MDQNGNPIGLEASKTQLTAYNGTPIPQYGALSCPLTWRPGNGKKPGRIQSKWYVADTPGPAILGLPALPVTMGNKEQPKAPLIPMVNAEKQQTFSPPNPSGKIHTKEQLIEEYPDCFKGIGRFPGTHKIHL